MSDAEILAELLAAWEDGDDSAVLPLHDLSEESGMDLLKVGECYYIRTLIFHYVGRVIECTPLQIVLDEASWVAVDSRYSVSLANGTFDEVEVVPPGSLPMIINARLFMDAVRWPHQLPTESR